ncbi:MAG: hypothetical protein K6F95_08985 [Selenomonas sp.]|uniref:hypothetical protein n=1 Tax=Selenomonas sp. TaxID=2053611 RepID=UPI0025FA4138|nr:hypothetical protein [Selenomonas sp.]MCR5758025.1 hypothetical protein [Selenomonas sp.]
MEIRRKLLMGGSVVLLGGILSGAWYANEAEKPPLVLQETPSAAQLDREKTEIIGLKQAAASKELRNPFSLAHEREGEQALNPVFPKDAYAQSPSVPVSIPAALPAAVHNTQEKSSGPGISLCGIVEGGGQRLALLRVGTYTLTAGLGEMAAGWHVTGISSSAVTVERSGEVLCLPLTMNSEAGAQ